MLDNLFGGWHLLIILLVVLLLFGATRLPALSKGIGQSIRIFRKEVKGDDDKGAVVDSTSSDSDKRTTPPSAPSGDGR